MWGWSFWWAVLAAFFSASFGLSNGPAYGLVLRANEEGRFSVMPKMIALNMIVPMALAGAAYWIADWYIG
jgi:hypothetical protein